jgi:hypothetical protein
MKKIVSILTVLLFLFSCDDGDIIVTTFDFGDVNLQSCQTNNGVVFLALMTEH